MKFQRRQPSRVFFAWWEKQVRFSGPTGGWKHVWSFLYKQCTSSLPLFQSNKQMHKVDGLWNSFWQQCSSIDWRRALLPETVSRTINFVHLLVTLEKREGACALFVQKSPDIVGKKLKEKTYIWTPLHTKRTKWSVGQESSENNFNLILQLCPGALWCKPARLTTFKIGAISVSVDGSHWFWYGWKALHFSCTEMFSVCW